MDGEIFGNLTLIVVASTPRKHMKTKIVTISTLKKIMVVSILWHEIIKHHIK
jgi:hypothetical protein